MYDLMQLRLFKAVAGHGSFSLAATSLRMSPSSVSRRIAQLEDQLGTRLFNRTTHDCRITREGRAFLGFVEQALDCLEEGERSLGDGYQRTVGSLKVLMPNSFCKNYLMTELATFLDRHPRVELDIHITDFGAELLSEGFDLGVQYGPPDYGGHVTRSIGAARLALVASPAYLEAQGVPRTPSDLANHRCIGFSAPNGTPFRWRFVRDGDGAAELTVITHSPARACYIDGQNDAVVGAAVHGVGVTPSDVVAALPYLRSGALKIVLPDYRLVNDTSLHLYYPVSSRPSRKVRAFIDFVVDVARRRLDQDDFDPMPFAA
jgi:LysR family transcriptional regulator, transcriptional activator for dmlA